MKQHITLEQIKKLSSKDRSTLQRWAERHYDSISCVYADIDGIIAPLFSIGQMIEFLDEKKPFISICYAGLSSERGSTTQWVVEYGNRRGWDEYDNFYEDELCDALWEAVKNFLDNEKL